MLAHVAARVAVRDVVARPRVARSRPPLRCGRTMATRKTLTFEKALARLLALMGSQVEVTILSEEPRGVLAYLEGELTGGAELAPAAYPANNERFAFRVGRAEAGSFVLERRMLRRAVLLESDGDGGDSLLLYVAITTVLQIDPVNEDS